VGLATLIIVFVVFGLFYLKRLVRRTLLPGEGDEDRRHAMAELLLLQTELQRRTAMAESEDDEETEPPPDPPAD
jgi:hypothetical protein